MAQHVYQLFYERNLPHYQPPGATFFITFRLAGSLPIEILHNLAEDARRREIVLAQIPEEQTRRRAWAEAQKQHFAKWDNYLDRGEFGPCWLAEPAVAKCVCDALHNLDGKLYRLDAYSVMPTHVHLACKPLENENGVIPLSKILHSLKSFTAHQANQILGRKGDFWQHESYDHVVRDDAEFQRIIFYILQNPIRAGLPDKWVYCAY